MNPLPCPFCQAQPSLSGPVGPEASGNWNRYAVSCRNADCGVKPFAFGATDAETIAAWNRRPMAATTEYQL